MPELPNLGTSGRERVGWIDLLRLLACFLVVFSHCCDPYIAVFDSDRTTFLYGTFAGSLVRSCVPLFVMMTGALLLPVRGDLAAFYRKRIGRILLALVFWSVALPLLYFIYVNRFAGSTSLDAANYTWEALGPKLWSFLFNFTYETTPLWYLYMLVGLYLIMPIVSPWLEKASRRDLRILLGIWLFTLLLPYIRLFAPLAGYAGNYGNMGIYGICDWNEFGTFHYVSGFLGYLLLAYYLRRFPPRWSTRRLLACCIPLFLAGYLITAFGYVELQNRFPGDYAYLEIIWYFAGLNVFMMTLPVFLVVQRINLRPRRWLTTLAGATFGIYLCHFIFVQIGYDLVQRISGLPVLLRILLIACGAFAVSLLLVRLLQRGRLTRRLVD